MVEKQQLLPRATASHAPAVHGTVLAAGRLT
jgi:hypothetical protein